MQPNPLVIDWNKPVDSSIISISSEERIGIRKRKREPTFEILGGINTSFHKAAMLVPSLYAPREERIKFRQKYGDIIDDVFSDYGEMYIRILRTIHRYMDEWSTDTVTISIKGYQDYPYMTEMVWNIAHSQFEVISEEIDKFMNHIFTIHRQNQK